MQLLLITELRVLCMPVLLAQVPESMLANLWFWSDHGTPRGWMHMDG